MQKTNVMPSPALRDFIKSILDLGEFEDADGEDPGEDMVEIDATYLQELVNSDSDRRRHFEEKIAAITAVHHSVTERLVGIIQSLEARLKLAELSTESHLGRVVQRLPAGYSLHHTSSGWVVCSDYYVGKPCATPTAAILFALPQLDDKESDAAA